jgi:hypothetical protein
MSIFVAASGCLPVASIAAATAFPKALAEPNAAIAKPKGIASASTAL